MPKSKPRRLFLQIKFDAPGANRREVLDELISSINRGDYDYRRQHPRWRVAIGWTNREPSGPDDYRWGEFRNEMQRSAQSSMGFDIAVRSYLESQQ